MRDKGLGGLGKQGEGREAYVPAADTDEVCGRQALVLQRLGHLRQETRVEVETDLL